MARECLAGIATAKTYGINLKKDTADAALKSGLSAFSGRFQRLIEQWPDGLPRTGDVPASIALECFFGLAAMGDSVEFYTKSRPAEFDLSMHAFAAATKHLVLCSLECAYLYHDKAHYLAETKQAKDELRKSAVLTRIPVLEQPPHDSRNTEYPLDLVRKVERLYGCRSFSAWSQSMAVLDKSQ